MYKPNTIIHSFNYYRIISLCSFFKSLAYVKQFISVSINSLNKRLYAHFFF